jgi:hypothetical protein
MINYKFFLFHYSPNNYLAVSVIGSVSAADSEPIYHDISIKIAAKYILENYGDNYVFYDSKLINDTYFVSFKNVFGDSDGTDLIVSLKDGIVVNVEETILH